MGGMVPMVTVANEVLSGLGELLEPRVRLALPAPQGFVV